LSYVIYLRKSRADEEAERRGEGETLVRHRRTLLQLAQRQGLHITQIYQELVSGETIATRPVMQRLLAEVEAGTWHGVLVMEVERLARGDTIDQGLVAQAFKYSGTRIVTPLKTYDPANEFDEEYFEFGLFMSRREYKTINRRLQRGRLAAAQEGRYCGSVPPYGYQRIAAPDGRGFTLTPLSVQQQVVEHIFRQFACCGESAAAIARQLNARHLPSASGKPWQGSGVLAILRNPVYCGMVRWGARRRVKTAAGGTIHTARPRSADCLLSPGLHPPLVSEELWDQTQARLSRRAAPPVPGPRQLRNPLAGLLYCGCCGKPMTRRPQKHGRDTLLCPTIGCAAVGCTLETAEQALLQALARWYGTLVLPPCPATQADGDVLLQGQLRQKAALESQLQRIFQLTETGVYDVETCRARCSTVRQQLAEIQVGIASLQSEMQKNARQAAPSQRIALPDAYTRLNVEEKNHLLRALVQRVEYHRTTRGAPVQLTVYPSLSAG